MKSIPTVQAYRSFRTRLRAFTLVEVMVSGVIFAMTSVSLTALFLQNLRFAKVQTDNVQVINSTFGLLDQIKNMGADRIWQAYSNPTTQTLKVTYVDPSDSTDGFKDLELKINKVGDKEVDTVWSRANFKTGRLATSPTISVSYWVTLNRNYSIEKGVIKSDVLELTLVYRWTLGGSRTTNLGQLQLSFPAPNGTFDK